MNVMRLIIIIHAKPNPQLMNEILTCLRAKLKLIGLRPRKTLAQKIIFKKIFVESNDAICMVWCIVS